MIFTRMQKYEKIGLVFVTVIIAGAFGMGPILMTMTSREHAGIASIGEKQITRADFINASRRWRLLYTFAQRLARAPEGTAWRKFISLVNAKGQQTLDKTITDKQVWIFLMLLKLAQDYGVQVTTEERQRFYKQTDHILAGFGETLREALRQAQIPVYQFTRTVHEMLILLKFIDLQVLCAKVGEHSVFERYRQKNARLRIRYLRFDFKNYMASLEKQYPQLRSQFLQRHSNLSVVPAKAQIGYLYLLNSEMQDRIRVSEAEARAAFRKKFGSEDDELDDQEKEIEALVQIAKARRAERFERRFNRHKAELFQSLKKAKARQTTLQKLEQAYNRLKNFQGIPNLEIAAEHFQVNYGRLDEVTRDELMQDDLLGTEAIANMVFQKMAPGKISPVLQLKNQDGYVIILLHKRTAATKLDLSQVKEDLFLRKYFEKHREAFKLPEQFEFEAVIADEVRLKTGLLICSDQMRTFYEEHKDTLFWDEEGKAPYPFAQVRYRIEEQLSRLELARQLTRRIEAVSAKLKDLGEEKARDIDLAEVARHPEIDLLYYKSPQPLSQKELQQQNPLADENLAQTLSGLKEGQVSQIQNSRQGRYLVRLIRRIPAHQPQFEEIRAKVREHFFKAQALKAALKEANTFIAKVQKRVKQQLAAFKQAEKELRRKLQQRIDNPRRLEDREQARQELAKLDQKASQREKFIRLNVFLLESQLASLHFKTTPLVKDFKNITALQGMDLSMVHQFREGQISTPLPQEDQGCVLVVQLVTKQYPVPEQTRRFQLQDLKWEQLGRLYQSRWQQWGDYQHLVTLTGFKLNEGPGAP